MPPSMPRCLTARMSPPGHHGWACRGTLTSLASRRRFLARATPSRAFFYSHPLAGRESLPVSLLPSLKPYGLPRPRAGAIFLSP